MIWNLVEVCDLDDFVVLVFPTPQPWIVLPYFC